MSHNTHHIGVGHFRPEIKNLKQRIFGDMRRLGVSEWGMHKAATRYLPEILGEGEQIGGVAYGRCAEGSVMIVATDRRVLYIDIKPLFKKIEDIAYSVVSGVTHEWALFSGTVTLHTKIADFKVSTMNRKASRLFVKYVEKRILEQQQNYQNIISTLNNTMSARTIK